MKGRWKDHSPTATGLVPVAERERRTAKKA